MECLIDMMLAVTHTSRSGKITRLEQVYVRGSHIRFIVLPDILKNAPVFKRVAQSMKKKKEEKTAGRGRGGAFMAKKKRGK
jgi:small nuclear ribonucleoprotein D3